MADARQRARRARLEAQHALLGRIFSRAEHAARQGGEAALGDEALSHLLDEALFSLSGLEVVVRCSKGLYARLAPLVAARAVALEEDASMSLGLIATTRDGAVSAENTVASRLARLRPLLAIEFLAECAPAPEGRA